MMTLEELRNGIDAFDQEIIELFKQRAAISADFSETGQQRCERLRQLNESETRGVAIPMQSLFYIFDQIAVCTLTPEGEAAMEAHASEARSLSVETIDASLVTLLRERSALVHEVGEIKKAQNRPLFAPAREYHMYRKIERLNNGMLEESSLTDVYREIVSCSFLLEGGLTIAYLGPDGSWSHQATLSRFGQSVERLACNGFEAVFDAVKEGRANYGILPIENSTEGSVSQVVDLLAENELIICAHSSISVQNCLLGNLPAEQIRTIYTHPQVFGQCRLWLAENYPHATRIAVASTAAAADLAREQSAQGAAALGSVKTAEVAGVNILQRNIQDRADNKTRFVVIGQQHSEPTGEDRTSLCFAAVHEAGTLVDALFFFKKHGINMYNICSRPMRGKTWEYLFFIDVAGHRDVEPLGACLRELEAHCPFVKVLGSYPES